MKYFTADTHFSFPGILTKMGRKGFINVPEHDWAILENINSLVSQTDTLYILGDFAWSKPDHFRNLINCDNIVFVVGNHDDKDAVTWAFGQVHDLVEVQLLNGASSFCTHYPMAFWDKSHKGSFHFYGHMHAQREHYLDSVFPERRSIDVGIDNAYRLKGRSEPFSEVELLDILGDRKGHDDIQFYTDFRKATFA